MRLRGAGPFRERREMLESSQMRFTKGGGLAGKDLENSIQPPPALNGQNRNRAETKTAADFHVNNRIMLGIAAILHLAGTKTLP